MYINNGKVFYYCRKTAEIFIC